MTGFGPVVGGSNPSGDANKDASAEDIGLRERVRLEPQAPIFKKLATMKIVRLAATSLREANPSGDANFIIWNTIFLR